MSRSILHILTRPADPVVDRLIADQRQLPGHRVLVHPLDGSEPDYDLLLERVFAADSVECW